MTAMFQLDYVPNGMFNLFLGQLREHSHVLINSLRDDVYYDFYRIRPEIEDDYWACRAGRVNFDCYMCPYCRGGWCQESCKESKEAKDARYDTKDVITFMHAAFLSALCDLAFSGREYDMRRAMTEAYTIDDEIPPDDAYADDDEVMPDDALSLPY